MTDNGALVRMQTTRLLEHGKTQGHATLLLYPDKLAAIRLRAFRIRWLAAAIAIGVVSEFFPVPPRHPQGVLEAVVLPILTSVVAVALVVGPTKKQAAAKVAAGGGDVTVIPLDLVTRLETGEVQAPARSPVPPASSVPHRDDRVRDGIRVWSEAGRVVGRSRPRLHGTRLRGPHHKSGHDSHADTQCMRARTWPACAALLAYAASGQPRLLTTSDHSAGAIPAVRSRPGFGLTCDLIEIGAR